MALQLDIDDHLNEQQILMLRLLKKPLPEDDFIQMRRLAVKLLAKQLDEVIGDWEEKNDIGEDYYKQLGQGHLRTPSKSS